MIDPVKRAYSSTLRETQSRQTRRVIVNAAARLFAEHGFGRTTVDAIAAEAGVSRKTVFSAVGGKVELLKLALDWAVAGDDEPMALEHRSLLGSSPAGDDPEVTLRRWVTVITDIAARMHSLSGALFAAAATDDAALRLWHEAQRQRLAGARAFVALLFGDTHQPAQLSLDHAADIVWLYSDPTIYRRLVGERGWTRAEFEDWLYRTVSTQLHP
jgi:AcrR family transcriptional regulator